MRVAKESLPFAIPLGLAVVGCALWLHPALTVPPLLLLLFTLWFFRDPERVVPDEPGVLVSPADGKVIRSDGQGISVFMNVFNVHVCRSPGAGRLQSVRHVAGRFLAAYHDAASEHNERAVLEISAESGEFEVALVAGLVARRIVLWVGDAEQLDRGQRVGLIRFGSRVDVTLPPGFEPATRIGQTVRAGQTIIARRAKTAAAARFPL